MQQHAGPRWRSSWLGSQDAQPTVRFLDASDLLGYDTDATDRAAVRAQLGGRWRVASIGPAGEALVRYATISNDGRHAGRTGTGAVMGSKRLKALALCGGWSVPVAHPEALAATAKRLRERSLGPDTAKYRELGTVANLLTFDRLGTLPTRNFQQATFEGAERLSGERLHTDRYVRRTACANCTVGCEQLFRVSNGKRAAGGNGAGQEHQRSRRLEYETLFALGPLLGIDDPDFVLHLAARCDELGMDTISTGGTIAWALEGAERGVLDRGALDGLDLRFGNKKAVATLVERIGSRAGVGHLLAEGSRRAAAHVGHGSAEWAMHVKGLELPGYEPRSLKTMALGLAIGSRGACHNRVPTYEADFSTQVDRLAADASRGQLAAEAEDREAVMDSLILCKFIRKCLDNFDDDAAHFWRLVTGWDVDAAEVRQVGARISTLKKVYNEREGWRRADDTLPPRLLAEPLPDGPASGHRAHPSGVGFDDRRLLRGARLERGRACPCPPAPGAGRMNTRSSGVRGARRLVFTGPGRGEMERFDLPAPAPHQVLVRATRTLVSAGTEVKGFQGIAPSGLSRFSGAPRLLVRRHCRAGRRGGHCGPGWRPGRPPRKAMPAMHSLT